MFDLCNTLSSSSIVIGDLNVHFDVPTNPLVLKINILLNRYCFYQAVTVPSHKLVHTPHIVMFMPTDNIHHHHHQSIKFISRSTCTKMKKKVQFTVIHVQGNHVHLKEHLTCKTNFTNYRKKVEVEVSNLYALPLCTVHKTIIH